MVARREIWLRPNRRILAAGLLVIAIGIAAAVVVISKAASNWARVPAWGLLGSMLALSAWIVYQWVKPRLAYRDGKLLVDLGTSSPKEVPIELVECFFLGQGPALLPRQRDPEQPDPETTTIVVRLAETAEEWKHFHMKPALGLWCDGYITIRGTWCEPITPALGKQLNERLIAAHRAWRNQQQDSA